MRSSLGGNPTAPGPSGTPGAASGFNPNHGGEDASSKGCPIQSPLVDCIWPTISQEDRTILTTQASRHRTLTQKFGTHQGMHRTAQIPPLPFLAAILILAMGFSVVARDVITPANADELEIVCSIRHRAAVVAHAFRPGSNELMTLDGASVLQSWDIPTGGKLSEIDLDSGKLATGAFSPNMRWLASGMSTNYATIRLWDLANDAQAFTLGENGEVIDRFVFSPDSRVLAVGRRNGMVELWDVETQTQLQVIYAHRSQVSGLAFSPDGKTLATGNRNSFCRIRLWDLATGEQIDELTRHTDGVLRLAYSHDGAQLVSAGADYSIILWDSEEGTPLHRLYGHREKVYGLSLSSVAPILASVSGDSTLRLWDLGTRKSLVSRREHAGYVYRVDFSPDGQYLVSSGMDFKAVIWGIPD